MARQEDIISMLKDPEEKVINFGPELQTVLQLDDSYPCEVDMAPGEYYRIGLGWAMGKGSPFSDLFAYKLTKMRESGLIDGILRGITSGVEYTCNREASVEPIGYKIIFTAFLMLAGGMIGGVASSVAENIVYRKFGSHQA